MKLKNWITKYLLTDQTNHKENMAFVIMRLNINEWGPESSMSCVLKANSMTYEECYKKMCEMVYTYSKFYLECVYS